MDSNAINSLLNDLLIEIHRSLMQYAAEAWPWSSNQAGELKLAVLSVAERQREDVGRLAHFLRQRGQIIDFGVYPVEYTSLHYVAIEFLYSELVDNQRALVRFLDESLPRLIGDPAAQRLASQIALSERDALQKLLAVEMPEGPQSTVWMK